MPSRVELHRHDYSLVTQLAAKGCSVETIADALFLSRTTFYELRKRDENLVEALELGRALEHDVLVGGLRRLADSGNVTALIFLLKSRHGYRDQGPDTTAVQAVNVQITLPAAKSCEDYEREIAAIDVTPRKESKS